MALWKYLVLVGSIIGVAGFFAPFFEYKAPDGSLTGASAYEIARNEVDVRGLMSQAEKLGLVDARGAAEATAMIEQGLVAYRYVMLGVFAPAALLLLLGLGSFARKKMGRLAGLLAIVLGLACVGVWIYFFRAPDPSTQAVAQLGLGIYCLLVCGLLSLLGGVGSLLAPDRTA